MVELLQNKNSATRFQIMVEIAASGQNVHQKDIAAKLGVSPQAISGYVRQLTNEELIEIVDRSAYKVSVKGVNWMLRLFRELNDYVAGAARAITNITISAAMAECDLTKGQVVGLKMEDGLLFATAKADGGAKGITVTAARKGQDVGISDIEGLVEFAKGKVTVLEVPSIQQGGSRRADIRHLKSQLSSDQPVGAIGIEALATLRREGVEPRYLFGVAEAAIEEASCGSPFLVACTADAIPGLIRKLLESKVDYEITSLAATTTTTSPSL